MSSDLIVLIPPPGLASPYEIPRDYESPILGNWDDIVAMIKEYVPLDEETRHGDTLYFHNKRVTLHLFAPLSQEVRNLHFDVGPWKEGCLIVADIARRLGARAIDVGNGEFLDLRPRSGEPER